MSNPKFVRELQNEKQISLQESKLYKERLKHDISDGGKNNWIFPAIRKDEIHFYYKGGRLFKYNGRFITNTKYGYVPKFNGKEIAENDVLSKIPSSFEEGYDQIKDRCTAYASMEALGVSALYEYSAWNSKEQDVVLLDIEAMFSKVNGDDLDEVDTEDRKIGYLHDRFDIVLYDRKNGELRIFEAKYYANKELWARGKPKVIGQIERYEKIIQERHAEILEAYTNQIVIMNKMFNKSLMLPQKLSNTVGLLIFGFDSAQSDKIKDQYKNFDVKKYLIGDVSGIKAKTLFNSTN